uniref:EF-hand domain-containing protein n=1 Tax=Schistocephalus solidus TaxID=70667 RepID=A0A183SSJ8_SCHSO
LGECLAALASCFPVAFLETELSANNPLSITYHSEEADYSFEARDLLRTISQTLPTLNDIIDDIARLAEAGSDCADEPHLIEVTLPMLCSYLPFWWRRNKQAQGQLARASGGGYDADQFDDSVDPMVGDLTENDENKLDDDDLPITTVTADLMNRVLGSVLQLIQNNIDSPCAPWMTRIATRTQPIVGNATIDMLGKYFLPVSERLLEQAMLVEALEEAYKAEKKLGRDGMFHWKCIIHYAFFVSGNEASEKEVELVEAVELLVRNMFALYPLLIKFVDSYRSHWLQRPTLETERLFNAVARLFLVWAGSAHFKREEETFVGVHEIDTLSLIMPSAGLAQDVGSQGSPRSSIPDQSRANRGKRPKTGAFTSLMVASVKRLLPIGLSELGGRQQELVQRAKKMLLKRELSTDIIEYLKAALDREDDSDHRGKRWQKLLYEKIDRTIALTGCHAELGLSTKEDAVRRIFILAKVMHGIYIHDHPTCTHRGAWKKLLSSQRKRAVMACFRMMPLYAMPRHRAINLFLLSYHAEWLEHEESRGVQLIEDITKTSEESETISNASEGPEAATSAVPVSTAIPTMESSNLLVRSVTDSSISDSSDTVLLLFFKQNKRGQSCSGKDEDDEGGDDGEDESEGQSFQEQEEQKQKLLSEQNRLADRGAAEMILLQLAAARGMSGNWTEIIAFSSGLRLGGYGWLIDLHKLLSPDSVSTAPEVIPLPLAHIPVPIFLCYHLGEATAVAQASIELGIAILLEGNVNVQNRMLRYLDEKRLTGFFTSLAGLMQNCSVLDLDTFERCNKAEGLAVGLSDMEGITNLYDADFTCKIFRFLQLLCEGHNLEFQDYLRTQSGNTTSVNLIICTVDYLLRLQESIMDFYWHYSNKPVIDESGKKNFIKAIRIGKQLFRTLTEYIQGPCQGNQLALAHSRLWDAISGFFYLFAHMQDNLSKDPEQLELLHEFLNLQTEMMIMLLSMLEGNVVNGPIGRQMVDTLAESSANVEMTLTFFDIFLRMKEITTSDAFLAFDVNKDGWISHREFRTALEQQKTYSELDRLLVKAKGMLETFEPYLGRIEITNKSGSIERVYFEIRQQNIDQWEKPQIKDSKRAFLHTVVGESGDKEKLECFVNFAEDTIFEMQHAEEISGDDDNLQISRVGSLIAFDIVTGMLGLIIGLLIGLTRLVRAIVCFCGRFFIAMASDPTATVPSSTSPAASSSPGGGLIRSAKTATDAIESGRNGGKTPSQSVDVSGGDMKPESNNLVSSAGPVDIVEMMQARQPSKSERQCWLLPEAEQLLLERIDPTKVPVLEEKSKSTAQRPKKNDQSEEKSAASVGLRQASATPAIEEPTVVELKPIPTSTFLISIFARNFYRFKLCALILAFLINFLLLCYRIEKRVGEEAAEGTEDASESLISSLGGTVSNLADNLMSEMAPADAEGDDIEVEEWITLSESACYLGPVLRILAIIHSLFSFSMLVAYYFLKVPLVIFKREKEISRMLEFDGMWISEQPSEDNFRAHWDKLVLSTPSFPHMYWDKFVKKKVLKKFKEQYDHQQIINLLGMTVSDSHASDANRHWYDPDWLRNLDVQYLIWKWGVIFTDNSFLYLVVYFIVSALGNLNYFFFSCHLLDVAISFKTLNTIVQSVTHNGKQLVLTVMLTSVVIYLYTVIAFNFFRKFYVKEDDGEKEYKCNDMLTCFIFHLHSGLRAGGGIGDEIEPPDGDAKEALRIVFDMTFFFFVIIILLAIIQGLIIDAFGDLRDQLEQVKDDLESKCFICGIGKEYFDATPHGFDRHVEKEHNFANYMYFLMHIINKPDTEFTGQETYVWELYQQRCWDFFPIGNCFRKQYEEELQAK